MRYLFIVLVIGFCGQSMAGQLRVEQVSDLVFNLFDEELLPEFKDFVVYRDELYFAATNHTGRYNAGISADSGLFKTDGMSLEQLPVDLFFQSNEIVAFDDKLYFRGGGDDRIELYQLYGDELTEIPLGSAPRGSIPSGFTQVGDRLYFEAILRDSPTGFSRSLISLHDSTFSEVTSTDQNADYLGYTAVGGTLIINTSSSDGTNFYRVREDLGSKVFDLILDIPDSIRIFQARVNGELYFFSKNLDGLSFYKTDGIHSSEFPAEDTGIVDGPYNLYSHGNAVYFTADSGNGYELHRTSGEVIEAFDLNPGPASSSSLNHAIATLNDQVLVPAQGPNGFAIFVIDADGKITQRHDLHQSPKYDSPGILYFREYQGEVYFQAIGTDGPELYKTDGENLTQFDIVPDMLPGSYYRVLLDKAEEFMGELYFVANTEFGHELVKTDGTNTTIFDITEGPEGSNPRNLQVFGDELVFLATVGFQDIIYSTDGTEVRAIANITPHGISYGPSEFRYLQSATHFQEFGEQLLFLANTPEGFKLHRVFQVPEPTGVTLVSCGILAILGFFYRRRL